MRSDSHIVATGLEPSDEEALVGEALTGNAGPTVLICEGPEIRFPGARPVIHYDMTARCREAHDHAVFDPARLGPALLRSGTATFVAQHLLKAVIDPDSGWRPPAGAGTDWSALVQPESWTVLPVVAAALWAAGAAGYGVREAMDWLASDQLAQIAAYCRSLAGPNPPPLIQAVESVVNGPGPARQEAVYLAWQTLAPVEAVVRNAPGVQCLDFEAWLSAQAVLAISLAPGAGVAEQQIVAGVLAASQALIPVKWPTDAEPSQPGLVRPTKIPPRL